MGVVNGYHHKSWRTNTVKMFYETEPRNYRLNAEERMGEIR